MQHIILCCFVYIFNMSYLFKFKASNRKITESRTIDSDVMSSDSEAFVESVPKRQKISKTTGN